MLASSACAGTTSGTPTRSRPAAARRSTGRPAAAARRRDLGALAVERRTGGEDRDPRRATADRVPEAGAVGDAQVRAERLDDRGDDRLVALAHGQRRGRVELVGERAAARGPPPPAAAAVRALASSSRPSSERVAAARAPDDEPLLGQRPEQPVDDRPVRLERAASSETESPSGSSARTRRIRSPRASVCELFEVFSLIARDDSATNDSRTQRTNNGGRVSRGGADGAARPFRRPHARLRAALVAFPFPDRRLRRQLRRAARRPRRHRQLVSRRLARAATRPRQPRPHLARPRPAPGPAVLRQRPRRRAGGAGPPLRRDRRAGR